MTDYIDRQAAIDAVNDVFVNHLPTLLPRYEDMPLKCASAIMRLPSVQPKQQWIPVMKALPDYGKTVLITNDKGHVRSGRFRGVEFWKDDGNAYWTFKGNTVEHVLAWMPLPEPYEVEEV